MADDRRQLWLRRLRRALRVTGLVLGSIVVVVLVVVLTVLLLPAGRRALLDKGLELAAGALPGELTVARADWPGLGRLELEGVLWTDGTDTLARADTLRLDVDISELLGRDLTIRRVLAAGVQADVPAIQARLLVTPADSASMVDKAQPAGPPPFPRAGSLPPVPSLAVDRLAVRRVTVIATPVHTVRLDSLVLSADLRHGHRPSLTAALRARPLPELGVAWRLAGHGDPDSLVFEVAPLWVDATAELPDPGALPLSGRLALPAAMLDSLAAGRLPVWPSLVVSRLGIAGETGAWTVDARLDGREPGFLQVESALPEAPRALLTALTAVGTDTLAPGLLDSLTARWGRDGDPGARIRLDFEPPPAPGPVLASRLVVDGDLRLPALATLAPLLPPQLVADDLGPILATVDLHYDGRTDPPRYDARIDLGRTAWIDAAYIAASGDTTTARLDSLLVRLPGLALEATGALDRDSLRTRLVLKVTDGSLLDRWRDPRLADLDPRADFLLDAVTAWPLPPLELPTALDPADPLAAIPILPSRIVFHGDLHLPPPSRLGTLLPPQLVVDDLGPVHLDMDLMYDGLSGTPRFAIRADLDRTEWLDALSFAATGDNRAVTLDSMVLRLPGLALSAAGRADADSVRLDVQFDLPDSTLLQRWNDPALVGVAPRARVSLQAEGAWPVPRVELAGQFGLVSPQLTVPELRIDALAATDTLVLDVELPSGLRTPQQELTLASVGFDGAPHDSLRALRGALRTELRAPHGGILLAARIDARDLVDSPAGTVTGDTLRLRLNGRGLTNTRPFTVTVGAANSVLDISDLELSGSLGRLGFDGRTTPDSLDGELVLALQLALETVRTLLPPEVQSYLPTGTLNADGRLAVLGPPASPWAGGRVRIAFSDNPDLGGLSAEADVSLGGSGEPPVGIDTGRAAWRRHSARVELSLRDADTLLTRVSALVPVPHPGGGKDSVDVRIDARAMDLGRLEPLLPGGFNLSGRLDADTRAVGLMAPDETNPELALSGGLRLSDLRLRAPDGSWMSMAGQVTLEGTSRAPVVRGGLDIGSGLIRIPDPPPSLLPASGDALLWQEAAPAADSLALAAPATADTVDRGASLPAFVPDLTFTVRCPGNLWLRGQGLDIELSGDLALHLRDGKPAIEGELKARQGTMKQLGRVFTLRRGRVIFYADESELNPELDLALGVRVNFYDITIALTGTATQPKLEFSSSPDLTEGDIVSVLLFGKTSDELDEGQSGLMAERAAQMALAYGSVQLQERLARELGVDVLSIAPRADDSSKSSLTVGKYLNPKVMVRYEQVLSDESAFFVHLDYSLVASQEWKLHSQVSQGEASGVEIKWEKEW